MGYRFKNRFQTVWIFLQEKKAIFANRLPSRMKTQTAHRVTCVRHCCFHWFRYGDPARSRFDSRNRLTWGVKVLLKTLYGNFLSIRQESRDPLRCLIKPSSRVPCWWRVAEQSTLRERVFRLASGNVCVRGVAHFDQVGSIPVSGDNWMQHCVVYGNF